MFNQLPDNIRTRNAMCAGCPFREGGLPLPPGRIAEIEAYLLAGVNHHCHGDDDLTLCRGARNYTLELWSRMGLIAEATDEALREAMRAAGVEPKKHI